MTGSTSASTSCEYGSNQRQLFLKNCRENHEALSNILGQSLSEGSFAFGERSSDGEGSPTKNQATAPQNWQEWLRDPGQLGIRAGVLLTRDQVLNQTRDELEAKIRDTFTRLFPLILLASLSDPMPTIGEYLGGHLGRYRPCTRILDTAVFRRHRV